MNSPYGSFAPPPITATPSIAPTTMPEAPAAERIRRHPQYYITGGDVYFLVQSYLFRVHRYFFERESPFFREKLGIPAAAGQTARGSSDANPFPLDDIRAEDFEKFLWVFYNPKYSIYDATVDEWEAILKIAYDWRFAEIKKLCCRELEKYDIEPVRKIAMYQTHELDKKLLIPSYAALTLRAEPLSFTDGRKLGLETALMLATARELARVSPSSPSPSVASLNDEVLTGIIRDIFQLSAGPPEPDLTPIDRRAVTFAATPVSPRRQPLTVSTSGSPRPSRVSSPTASSTSGAQSFGAAAASINGDSTNGDANLLGLNSENGSTTGANGTTPAPQGEATATTGENPAGTETAPTPAPGPSPTPPKIGNGSGEGAGPSEKEPATPRSGSPSTRGGRNPPKRGGKGRGRDILE